MDLGSNTLRLLVARVDTGGTGGWQALNRGLATPRLGQGLDPGGSLAPEAKEAARGAASLFVQKARDLGARSIFLGATQACRIAKDGPQFVEDLESDLGLAQARVLSALQEARLARLGALSRLEGPTQGSLLADVGGGSTELIALGRGDERMISLSLGAVSLTEALLAHDPPSQFELTALDQAVQKGLLGLDRVSGHRAARLVATAGTAATLASLRLGLEQYQPERINNLRVGLAELEEESARLSALPLEDRRRVPGLEPERADIILAGLAVLRGLLRYLSLDEITVMDAGLLEGILLDGLGKTA
ncbi:MAG: hypothetical protein PVG60_08030 [Desulfarculaceae bacterium]|jgi:exopolyphosphatase/guanosine-5'-triphosphate,3'-diphosphate pyrophosphatase